MEHDRPGIRTRIATFYDRLALVGAIAFVVLLVAIPLFGLGVLAIDIATHLDTPLVRVAAVAMALGIGILAFRIRVMHRALYGVIEIGLAIVISWFTFADVAPKSPGLVAGSFIGAVYFVVRGLDNATHDRTALEYFFFGVRKSAVARASRPRSRSAAPARAAGAAAEQAIEPDGPAAGTS